MLAVTGRRTSIVTELEKLIAPEPIVRIDIDLASLEPLELLRIPPARRYLLAAGVLHQKPILEQSPAELAESVAVNCINVIRLCEAILGSAPAARICIIGSMSAYRGSFDETYAVTKAGVHAYVRFRKVGPLQQLALIPPPIISDSGMTQRRQDFPAVLEQRHTIKAIEVARLVKFVLWDFPAGRNSIEYMHQ